MQHDQCADNEWMIVYGTYNVMLHCAQTRATPIVIGAYIYC